MIYLDNAATTEPNWNLFDKTASEHRENYFNPSALYKNGVEAKELINRNRSKIADLVSNGRKLIFTSGGTEADNQAIFSFATRGNAVTSLSEHAAVFNSFQEIKKRGVEVRYAALNPDASVKIDSLLGLIDEKTSFVSVMHVNNETGAINDINAIAKEVKKINPKTVFHSDGVQAFGKLEYRISENVDLYSISAHKIGALKGVGALIYNARSAVKPLIYGGGQETGLRSGTENTFGIENFALCAEERYKNLKTNYSKVLALNECFRRFLRDDGVVMPSTDNGSPYIISLLYEGIKGEVLMHLLETDGIIVGTGSACASKSKFSRPLKESGYSEKKLMGAIRISFSPENTTDEVRFAAESLNKNSEKLRKIMR